MGLFDVTQLALERALQGAGLRQQALSNNLANVNTPGFKRSDVDFHTSLAAALAGGEPAVAGASFAMQTDSSTSMRADGNNVDVDQEMASLTENASEYQALAAVAKSRLQMIQTAIGSR
jgi:flagellar basal-body rod protein FlgB